MVEITRQEVRKQIEIVNGTTYSTDITIHPDFPREIYPGVFWGVHVKNVTFKNMTMQGPTEWLPKWSDAKNKFDGIYVHGCEYLTVEDCQFYNIPGNSLKMIWGGRRFMYERNRHRFLWSAISMGHPSQKDAPYTDHWSGHVRDNISLERADLDAARVESVARAVQAHGFIDALAAGYDTRILERGVNLSAGQRQLLSFARALAHGADVLVLDEATSSIDTETEVLVQRGIHALIANKTALVIAHRLSTIRDVDRIYVLHKGCIVESGPHGALLAQGGIYARLYRLQVAHQRRGAEEPGAGRARV